MLWWRDGVPGKPSVPRAVTLVAGSRQQLRERGHEGSEIWSAAMRMNMRAAVKHQPYPSDMRAVTRNQAHIRQSKHKRDWRYQYACVSL